VRVELRVDEGRKVGVRGGKEFFDRIDFLRLRSMTFHYRTCGCF